MGDNLHWSCCLIGRYLRMITVFVVICWPVCALWMQEQTSKGASHEVVQKQLFNVLKQDCHLRDLTCCKFPKWWVGPVRRTWCF